MLQGHLKHSGCGLSISKADADGLAKHEIESKTDGGRAGKYTDPAASTIVAQSVVRVDRHCIVNRDIP